MREGNIEQIGGCEDVYERPRTRFVASFIGDSNLLECTVQHIDGRTAVVDCNGMQVRVICNETVGKNRDVCISLRPERIVVGSRADSCTNAFQATVEKAVYKGSGYEYEVRLPSGDVVVTEVSARDGPRLRPGDSVTTGFEKEACVAVCDE
jgi:ABC-type Fe3+/spermidine/putrescine transport system ATPase subunit